MWARPEESIMTFFKLNPSPFYSFNSGNTSGQECPVGMESPWQKIPRESTEPYESPEPTKTYEALEITAKMLSYFLVVLVGTIGNIVIILVVSTNTGMRTKTNILIMNLALSDLFVLTFCSWVHLGDNITTDWPFGTFVCTSNPFFKG